VVVLQVVFVACQDRWTARAVTHDPGPANVERHKYVHFEFNFTNSGVWKAAASCIIASFQQRKRNGTMTKTYSRAIAKLTEVKAPISGKMRGTRLVVAHPNMAGMFFGKPCPSFRKPYAIAEFAWNGGEDTKRAIAEMERQGYAVDFI
jgi:hypothetical protein